MTRRLAIAFAAAFVAVFLCAPAAAQTVCADRDDVVQRLWDRWQEAQIAFGLANDGRIIEVFVSSTSQSWTIIISDANGRSCVAGSGKNWSVLATPTVPGKGI